jgi:hypothetical protein
MVAADPVALITVVSAPLVVDEASLLPSEIFGTVPTVTRLGRAVGGPFRGPVRSVVLPAPPSLPKTRHDLARVISGITPSAGRSEVPAFERGT